MLFLNRLFQLTRRDAGLQSESDLGSGCSLGHIPALGFPPRLAYATGLLVIGMNLHRELLVWEQKLKQKWEAAVVAGGLADQVAAMLLTQLRETLAGEWPVCHFAFVAGQPRLANLLLEFVVGINRREIVRAPRARVEACEHQQWIQLFHDRLHKKRPLAERPRSPPSISRRS